MSDTLTRFHSLTRREFTVESVLALLAGVTITVSGCGSSSSPSSPSPAPTADVSGVISANHGHTAVVTAAQITAANEMTLNIQGQATHSHLVTLTAAQFRTIGAKGQVVVQSTTDAGHQHTVTFN